MKAKVLLLNSVLDRETPDYTALDFVEAITAACSASYGDADATGSWHVTDFISHIVYLEGTSVEVDYDRLQVRGNLVLERGLQKSDLLSCRLSVSK